MINVRDEALLERFGKHLAKLRKQKKVTQRKLAYDSDISISQISRIERGLINPTLSTLNTIAASLQIPLKELLEF